MALHDFQRALTAMTLDPVLANAVHAQGADALLAFRLTPREARRLTAVARQPGMALNCTLARANRFGPIHAAFPMSCRLLGRELRTVLDALWSGRDPANYQLSGEEIPFADLVEARVADRLSGSDYLGEVLAYERACLELALPLRMAADPLSIEQTSRWVDFRHDPRLLFDALDRSILPPPGLPEQAFRVRVTLVEGELEVTTFEVRTEAP